MASDKKKRNFLIAGIALAVLIVAAVILLLVLKDRSTVLQNRAVLEDKDTVALKQPAPGESKPAESMLGEYALVTENLNYAMYLYEPTMSIKLLNKVTGVVLDSTLTEELDDKSMNKSWRATLQSGINITAIKGNKDNNNVDLVSCKNTISYEYLENGFIADIFFAEYGFGLKAKVLLEGDSLVASVPNDSIVETKNGIYVCTVTLFPFLGMTRMGEENGYMLVPDGNGALIYLDDKDGQYSSGFSQMIYGKDAGFDDILSASMWDDYVAVNAPEEVLAPIFGMAHLSEQQAFLGIVEKGEERASIEAQPNGVMINFNRCYAKFGVRMIYVQPLNQSNTGTQIEVEKDRTRSDLQVRFLLLSGDQANYSGMAVAYRNYLLENGMLEQKNTEYRTRVDFLGTDNEEFMMFTSPVTMTTTDQIRSIYEELKEAGVESLLTVYKGWQKGGIYNLPVKKYKASGEIGGTKELTRLIADAAKDDYKLYLYVNALEANPEESNTTFNTIKKINKRRLEINTYGQVYQVMNYLVPSKAEAILNTLIDSCKRKGVTNLALAGITNNLFCFTYNGTAYSRRDTQEAFYRMVSETAEKTDLVLESPCAYLWTKTDVFLDMPLESSHYMYLDEEVPFLSMVLKGILPMYSGYINFEANRNEFFLRMVEAGVYPSFYLTGEDSSKLIYTNSADLYSTLYTTYIDTVKEYDTALRALSEQVQGAMITRHEKLPGGVTRVMYDNGVVVYINYTEEAVTVDGYTIEAMSYKAGESR